MAEVVFTRDGDVNPYVSVAEPVLGGPFDQSLYAMGLRLLELVKSVFVGSGRPLPGREVVYPSPIPADCEQVAVLFTGWTPWPGGEGPMNCERFRWLADFSIIITRTTPAVVAGKAPKTLIPTAEKMHNAGKMASDDAELLLEVLRHIGEIANPSVTVQSPVGGLQTTELNVQIPAGSF